MNSERLNAAKTSTSRTPGSARRRASASRTARARSTRSGSAGHDGAAAQGGAAVAELAGLHGLALAAVGNRVEPEGAPDPVDVHQELAPERADAARAVT